MHNKHGAQINFGDLTPYLTSGLMFLCFRHYVVIILEFVAKSIFYNLLSDQRNYINEMRLEMELTVLLFHITVRLPISSR